MSATASGASTAPRRLMTNAGALAVGGIVAQATFVIVEALIARRLGVVSYGIYSSCYVLITLMSHAMDMGMYWKLVQDGARDPATLRVNLGTMMVARIGLFFVAYPSVLGILWMMHGDSPEVRFFALFAFFGLQLTIQDLLSAACTARQRMASSAMFQAAVPVLVLVAVSVSMDSTGNLPALAWAFIAGSAVVTVSWTWIVWRQERPVVRLGQIGEILKGCIHYGISGLVWNAYLRIGVLVLTFVSAAAQVALFAAAFKLIDLIFKVAVLANRVVAPRLFADSQHRPQAFRRTADALLRMTVAVSAAGALALYVAGSWLVVLIYGADFAASGELIRWLGISLTLKTIALIAQTILSASDDHGNRTRVVTIAAIIALVAVVPASLHAGAAGAARAVVAADVILLALLAWRIHRTGSVTSMASVFLTPLLAASLSGAAVIQAGTHVVWELVMALAIFLIILVATGYLSAIGSLLTRKEAA